MISWNGIGQPTTNLDKKVRVRLRDGGEIESRVGDFDWTHGESSGDIVAYDFGPIPGGSPVWDADDQSTGVPPLWPAGGRTTIAYEPGNHDGNHDTGVAKIHLPPGFARARDADDQSVSESRRRKEMPLARGCMDYFPDALLAVAELSFLANEKHNPGEPMHWSKGKSNDHADCCARHLLDRGTWIEGEYARRVRHSTAAAWRALANLQTEIEESA
ncbi:MAG: DUF5664 domain-containing protein [Deltaproteobacteria bacterium]|nr:DUF5664 domain-containing protein [Deltaproteobacteria bacterium]